MYIYFHLCIYFSGDTLQLQPYHTDNYFQQWTITNDTIFNMRNKHMVIGIKGGHGRNGCRLEACTYAELDSQRWRIQNIHDGNSSRRNKPNPLNSLFKKKSVSQPIDNINGQPVY